VDANRLFNVSLKGTRTALIATGIGLFVVALGTVIVLWDDIIDAIDNVNGKLQERIDLSLRQQESLRTEISLLDKQIILLDKQGVSSELIRKKRVESLEALLLTNAGEITALGLKAANLKASTLELNTREKILRAVMNTVSAGSGDAYLLSTQQEAADEFLAIQELITKSKEEQLDIEIKLFDLNNPEKGDGGDGDKKREPREEQKSVGNIEAQDIELEGLKTFNDKMLDEGQRFIDAQILADQIAAADKIQAMKVVEETRQEIQNVHLNSVQGFNSLLESLGIKSKALQAASIVAENIVGITKNIAATQSANAIATATGIAYAVASGGASVTAAAALVAANNISSGISIAASVAATAKGLAALGGGSGGGGGSAPQGGGGGGRQAPAFNLVEGTESNQIAEGLNRQNAPIEAFVVSSAVTNKQALERNIESNSTIG
jgi:hypothetical protein